MLKPRLIGALPVRDGIVVQSIEFTRFLPVGRPEIATEAFDRWGVDEIILVDITASREGRSIDPKLVKRVSKTILVPLLVGGGLTNLEQIRMVLDSGAEKITLCTSAQERPGLVEQAVHEFGSQCIIGCLDVRRTENDWGCFVQGGTVDTGLDVKTAVHRLRDQGVGEVLLHSIDQDGTRCGYDLDLAALVVGEVNMPVICLGGCGEPSHVSELLRIDGTAAAVGNMLHYSEHSIALLKAHVSSGKDTMRIDEAIDYTDRAWDDDSRLRRLDDRLFF